MKLDKVFDTDNEAGFIYRWFLKKRDEVLTDNIVFFLHYHVTSALFFIGCLLATVGMFIMDPIDCIADKAVDDVIDNYCLYHSTYTITSDYSLQNREHLVAHPGISPISNKSSDKIKFHHYYLWVALLLVIQGASFYIPRGIWKYWGGSRVHDILRQKDEVFLWLNEEEADNITHQTHSASTQTIQDEQHEAMSKRPLGFVMKETSSEENFKKLLLYILSKKHSSYYFKLFFCELMNLVNAFVQLLVINNLLGFGLSRKNLWYNKEIFQLFQDSRPFQRNEATEQLFPKVSACTFYSYGPSGSIVNYQAVCVLSVNAINEKIYAALYVWLLFLIVVSFLAVLYRLLILLPFVRNALLKIHLRTDELKSFSISKLRRRLRVGNWQLLLQLTGNSNMDSWELTNIVKRLCRKFEHIE